MKLLLTSAGLRNDSIVAGLQDLLGKPFTESELVFIPTAANFFAGDKYWLIDRLIETRKLGWKQLDIVDVSALKKEQWLPRFERADVLYFSGGSEGYLMHWLNRAGASSIIRDLLRSKIYMGFSAGSIVASYDMMPEQLNPLFEEDAAGYEERNGLGLVDFLVVPHLNRPDYQNITLENIKSVAGSTDQKIYALDDESAVKVDGNIVEVISEGQWKLFE